jgi:hypothetical protein
MDHTIPAVLNWCSDCKIMWVKSANPSHGSDELADLRRELIAGRAAAAALKTAIVKFDKG